MNIDPTNPATMQMPMANKVYQFAVRHGPRLKQALVRGQELPPASAISDKEFSEYQLVPNYLVKSQKPVQLLRLRLPVSKKTDPYRTIDQNHQTRLRETMLR